jgi:hypothetical protein
LRASGGCSWQIASDSAWLVPAAGTGNGDATLNVTVQALGGLAGSRDGWLTLQWSGGSVRAKVIEAGCEPATFPDTVSFDANGNELATASPRVFVPVWATNPYSCPWNVTTAQSWIGLTKANQTFGVSTTPNAGPSRTGSVEVTWYGGRTISVVQAAKP